MPKKPQELNAKKKNQQRKAKRSNKKHGREMGREKSSKVENNIEIERQDGIEIECRLPTVE